MQKERYPHFPLTLKPDHAPMHLGWSECSDIPGKGVVHNLSPLWRCPLTRSFHLSLLFQFSQAAIFKHSADRTVWPARYMHVLYAPAPLPVKVLRGMLRHGSAAGGCPRDPNPVLQEVTLVCRMLQSSHPWEAQNKKKICKGTWVRGRCRKP